TPGPSPTSPTPTPTASALPTATPIPATPTPTASPAPPTPTATVSTPLPTITPAPQFAAWRYGARAKGYRYSYISWSGSTAAGFDVRRDGKKIATVYGSNDYTDELGKGGNQTFRYDICETGSQICSGAVSISF